MKRTILLTMFLWGICASLQAQEIDGVSARNVTMGRNGAYMAVDMDEEAPSQEFFAHPKEARTREFLQKISHTE